MRLGVVALLVFVLGACALKEVPPGSLIVDRVDVIGAEKTDDDELKKRLATARTEHALSGLLAAIPVLSYFDALTVEYRTLDRLILERDLQRVRRWYRARGFYDAMVRAGRVVKTEEGHVRVEIVVEEGEPVLVQRAELDFPDWRRAFRVNAKLVDLVAEYERDPIEELETGPRFDEDRYDELKSQMRRVFTANGFAYAEVEGNVNVDVAKRLAHVKLKATAGPFCHVGEVTFEGLGEIPEGPVREALGIKRGDTFSSEAIEQAHYALADFQVFGATEIQPQLSEPGEPYRTQIPIVVRVQPMKLRGVKLGAGLELGTRLEVHGVAGWEDRNFLGGLRKLTIDVEPALVFFPFSASTLFEPPSDYLVIPEVELDVRFKQPGFPDPRSNLLINAGSRFYRPRPLSAPDDFDAERDNIVIYREVDGAVGLERRFRFPYWGGFSYYGSPLLKVQYASPRSFNFDDPPDGFNDIFIPYIELINELDFRKNRQGKPDAKNPASGAYFSLNAQFAALGSAEDIRLQPELRLFAPLGSHVVLAVRWTTGYLFSFNYGDALLSDSNATEEERARDLQLMAARAFFSGGPSSNRGYRFRDVGPHEVLSFLSQTSPTDELLPSGGRGMWELSGELRISLTEALIGVLFLDASDVVRTLSDFRVSHPHLSPGLGVRFKSQVGRVRFDLGFQPPYLQEIGEPVLTESEGGPEGGQSPVPLAFHVAIGESI